MKISIIMPVYNAEKTIRESLDSIQEQSFRDFDIVFIDDCSTDGTSAILEGFQKDSGIPCRIVRQEKNYEGSQQGETATSTAEIHRDGDYGGNAV